MAVSLRTLLIVPFVLQVLGITGLVGYVSYRSGQRAVQDIARQLMVEMGQRVEANLETYLQVPETLTRVNAQVMITDQGQGPPLDRLETSFLQQIQGFPEIIQLTMATPAGAFLGVSRLSNDTTLIRHRTLPSGIIASTITRGMPPGKTAARWRCAQRIISPWMSPILRGTWRRRAPPRGCGISR